MVVDWIKANMEARHLLQKDIAVAVGWTEVQASKVMNRGRRVQANELLKLMEFFGYPTPNNSETNQDMHTVIRSLSSIDESQRRALVEYITSVARK